MKTGAAMKKEGTLTPKQAEFVRQYLVDLNATHAALRAGYSKKTARTIGYELVHNPDVVAAIEKAKAERAHRTGLSADWIVERLMTLANKAEPDAAKVAALRELTKHSAARDEFADRQEVTGKDGGPVEIVIRTLPAEP